MKHVRFPTFVYVKVQPNDGKPSRRADPIRIHELRDFLVKCAHDLPHYDSAADLEPLQDGFVATFAQPSHAVDFAGELQVTVRNYFRESDDPTYPCIGVYTDRLPDDGYEARVTTMRIAMSLSHAAAAGQTLVADAVRELVAGRGFMFVEQRQAAAASAFPAGRTWELLY